jgi:hypothetical protein
VQVERAGLVLATGGAGVGEKRERYTQRKPTEGCIVDEAMRDYLLSFDGPEPIRDANYRTEYIYGAVGGRLYFAEEHHPKYIALINNTVGIWFARALEHAAIEGEANAE